MKINKKTGQMKLFKFFATINLLLSPIAINAHAQADHAGNGGETISIKGVEYLKDLASSSNCVWYSTHDFIHDELKDFNIIEDYLHKTHEELYAAFKKQSVSTSVCLTNEKLIRIDTADKKSLFLDQDTSGNQIAIRLNEAIFINNKLFKAVVSEHKKYLILHELLHGLMGKAEVDFRYVKVRSFISNLKNLIENEDYRESKLAVLIQNTVPRIHLFSGEKKCGVFKESVLSIGEALKDCYSLYSGFAYVDSDVINVIGGRGEERFTEIHAERDVFAPEDNTVDRFGRHIYRYNLYLYITGGKVTLIDNVPKDADIFYFFNDRKAKILEKSRVEEFEKLKKDGTLKVEDCFRLHELSCSVIKDNMLALTDSQYEKIYYYDFFNGLIALANSKETIIKVANILKKSGHHDLGQEKMFYEIFALQTATVSERVDLLEQIQYPKNRVTTFKILSAKNNLDHEARCSIAAEWDGSQASSCKELKKDLSKKYDLTGNEKELLKELSK